MPVACCSACQKSTIYTKNGIAHCRGGNLPPGHFGYKMASPTAIIIYFLRKSQQLLRNYWAGGRLPPLRLLSKISGFLTVCAACQWHAAATRSKTGCYFGYFFPEGRNNANESPAGCLMFWRAICSTPKGVFAVWTFGPGIILERCCVLAIC